MIKVSHTVAKKTRKYLCGGMHIYARGAGGRGSIVLRAIQAAKRAKLRSKTITSHNAYYVKFIIEHYQSLNPFATPMIVLLTRLSADLPRLLLTGI